VTLARNLHELVIAFDIDNTLLDPDGSNYRRKVAKFLATHDLGRSAKEASEAFEWIRRRGAALERIGLANPRHEPGGADGLAVLCLLHCVDPDLQAELGIDPDNQSAHRAAFAELSEQHRAARHGGFGDRLDAECRVRKFCATDPRIARLREEALRIARHPRIGAWAKSYNAIENEEPLNDVRPLLTALRSRGATPIVITEGRGDIQTQKLERLGVADFFDGRVLITETAAAPPGIGEFNTVIAQLVDEKIHSVGPSEPNTELQFLWYYRCLIDEWSIKSASFYGRCLHAMQCDQENPQSALAMLAVSPATQWSHRPLRLVMVGDRYDLDVLPLIELLGSDNGMTLRLRMGKYASLHPDGDLLPHLRPTRTFTGWDALSSFLIDDLSVEHVQPISGPPFMVSPKDVRTDYLDRGLTSPLQSVRVVAELLSAAPR